MARSRYKFKDHQYPYFMTFTTVHWLPIIFKSTYSKYNYGQYKVFTKKVKIYAWVMLENHIHVIGQSDNISQDIARFKAFTAKQILAYLTELNVKTILDQLKYYKKSYKGENRKIQ